MPQCQLAPGGASYNADNQLVPLWHHELAPPKLNWSNAMTMTVTTAKYIIMELFPRNTPAATRLFARPVLASAGSSSYLTVDGAVATVRSPSDGLWTSTVPSAGWYGSRRRVRVAFILPVRHAAPLGLGFLYRSVYSRRGRISPTPISARSASFICSFMKPRKFLDEFGKMT